MKTHFFRLLVVILAIGLSSCKKENSFSDYKYADKPALFSCENLNSKLYQEAIYSFENDILNYHKENNPEATLRIAYSQFLLNSMHGKPIYEDYISKHSLKVFQALKKEKDLWHINNKISPLNYNNKVLSCIAKNIEDKALNQTLNALLSTNTMKPELFGTLLTNKKYKSVIKDKYLACYIALDFYYAKLFNVDLSKIKEKKPKNTTESTSSAHNETHDHDDTKDDHTDHNH